MKTKPKRVTAPLDEKVKARIVGQDPPNEQLYFSSGSEHSAQAEAVDDAVSPSLSILFFGLGLQDNDVEGTFPLQENQSDSELDPSTLDLDSTESMEELMNLVSNVNTDSFRNMLLAQISKAVEISYCIKSNKPVFRRNVMAFLRECGYNCNAAICKTKWESSGGLVSGSYEFIDVLLPPDSGNNKLTRYIIDLDFASEFEIARPTNHYQRLLKLLPKIFVGRSEELKRMVKIMSDAAKRSLKSRGLCLPPWRKNRYMQNKWFGPFRRTFNPVPASMPLLPSPAMPAAIHLKCRSVGFDAVNGGLFYPVKTRTR